jgi:hypothetical protein
MQRGLLNLLHKTIGGKLYHCWFCRLQFYDIRQRFNAPERRGDTANENGRQEASSRTRLMA